MTNLKSEFVHKLAKEEKQTMKQNAMSLNLTLLYIAGIAVPPSVKPSTFKMTLYKAYVTCCYLVYLPVLSGQILALYHFWGNMDISTNNIFTLLGVFLCFTQATYAIFNSREIVELFHTFQNKVLTKMATVAFREKEKEIFDSATKKARRVTFTIMILMDMMVAVWFPAPFVKHLMEEHKNVTDNEIEDEKKWLNFCYIIWFPTDITVSPYFEIMYVMQCIVFIVGTLYVMAIDMTAAAMMVHISAQFQILYTALEQTDTIFSLAKEKNVGKLQFLKPRAVNMSLKESNELTVTGAGSPAGRGPRECQTTDVTGTLGNTETKNEDLPEVMRYLANFVDYHQAVIE